MRAMWSLAAIERSLANGVTPAEANSVLRGPGKRLLIPINDSAYRVVGRTVVGLNDSAHRVVGRTVVGRLVEVWLDETDDGWWEVIEAFEAGFDGQARWRNVNEE